MTLTLPRAALAALLLALPALPAQAQGPTRLPGSQPAAPAAQRAAPPALPGLQGRQSTVTPAEVPPSAMNPNDALFDGIARGDLPAVRDAVNRGADLRARNPLGLTPVEAAVDRARPEITFYLLSVRGGAGMASSGPPPEAAAARGRPQPPVRPARVAPVRQAPTRPGPVVRADGGQPIPSIGFLGFDPRG